MHPFARSTLACLCFLAAAHALATDEPPMMAKPGKLLFEDDFSRPQLAPRWKIGLGFFNIREGVVVAEENPADHHGAYAYADPHFPYKDAVVEFSFKFDGDAAKSCSLRLDDTEYTGSHAGHIIRATITPAGADLDDSKYGSMKNDLYDVMRNPASSPEERRQAEALIRAHLSSYKVEFDLANWHQARVEVMGDEMLLHLDGQPVGYLKSEGVDHPTKNAVGFTVGGQSILLYGVKVWNASPVPSWPSRRGEILAALRKIR